MANNNARLHLAPGAVLVAEGQNLSSVTHWVDYAIWGLLFHDDQSPWLTLVECLHICFDRKQKPGPIFSEPAPGPGGQHETLTYGRPLNHPLRHLVFRDTDIAKTAAGRSIDDKAKWKTWLDRVAEDYPDLALSFLQDEFSSFGEMARSVDLMRSIDIEPLSPKRWTSHHMLPLGPAMLFPDVNEKGSLDRKFMRRTGEMLYLMLNRSKRRDEVGDLIDERLLGESGVWNRLATRLAGSNVGMKVETTLGYLPMPTHETYENLATDWISLLSLTQIPVENILDPLQRISGLVQLLYILKRAQETIADDIPLPPFFLDLVGAPGNNPIRKLSANQYKRHRTLPLEATAAFLEAFEQSDDWKEVLASDAGSREAVALLAKRFLCKKKWPSDPDHLPSAAKQLAELRTEAQAAKGHSVVSTLNNHARHAGLLRAQRSSGTWYAPNDAFLEALVLANVTTPMEFGDFLALLLDRYNIAIGPEEVRRAFNIRTGTMPAPVADLKENERRLEERLRILGVLDRKSDDCAFVINPFYNTVAAAAGGQAFVDA
jgi:hypothetical protein